MKQNEILFVLWIVVIGIFAFTPVEPAGEEIKGLDKVGHFAVFFIFALTALRINPSMKTKYYFAIVAAALVYGLIIEIFQPFVGREFDLLDLAADTFGAAFFFIVWSLKKDLVQWIVK